MRRFKDMNSRGLTFLNGLYKISGGSVIMTTIPHVLPLPNMITDVVYIVPITIAALGILDIQKSFSPYIMEEYKDKKISNTKN
jgi:hypothetical protein